jgi:sugar/nucleoside kinase (ribokinase family)
MPGANVGSMGELLVEFVATARNGRHRVPGQYIGPFASGAPGIFIDQAAKCGGNCILVGAVGDDAFGSVLLDRLEKDGVDMRLIKRVSGVPTGTAFVSCNDDGGRDFVYNVSLSAASRFEADQATIAALAGFDLDVFHVSGSALADPGIAAKIMKVCDTLHAWGVKISFDPNVRRELLGGLEYNKAVHDLMARCSIFLPSEEDAGLLFPGEGIESFAPKLLSQGANCVVLKNGAQGAEAVTGDGRRVSLKAHSVEAVDPTGAGDCFCATFVTLMAGGKHDLRAALERANAAGALAVMKTGPMEGVSTLGEIETFLAARR